MAVTRIINGEEFISVGLASKELGLSPATVRRWCDEGLPGQPRPGGPIRLETVVDDLNGFRYISRRSIESLKNRYTDKYGGSSLPARNISATQLPSPAAAPPSADPMPDSAPDLIRLFRNAANGAARRGAVEAIGRLRLEAAVSELRRGLQDSEDDPVIRAAIVDSLGRIANRDAVLCLLEALNDEDEMIRFRTLDALSTLPPDAGHILLDIIRDRDSEWDLRRDAIRAAGLVGSPEIRDLLLETLEHPSDVIRELTATALGEMSALSAVARLCDRLNDVSTGVQVRAIESLGRIGSTAAVPSLLEACRSEHGGVRSAAVESLAAIGCPDVIPALIDALKDPLGSVRAVAARALGRAGVAEAVPALIEASHDGHAGVREQAAAALQNLGRQ